VYIPPSSTIFNHPHARVLLEVLNQSVLAAFRLKSRQSARHACAPIATCLNVRGGWYATAGEIGQLMSVVLVDVTVRLALIQIQKIQKVDGLWSDCYELRWIPGKGSATLNSRRVC
jgi:hypothetical protein